MGNNQSIPGHHHHRLSKPKTYASSPVATLATDSPSSVTSRYTDWSAKGRNQVKERPRSILDTEAGSIVCANNEEDAVAELASRPRGRPLSIISRSNSRTNSRSNSLSCFGSKHGSSTKLTDLNGSKNTMSPTVDVEAAIRLLQEVKKHGTPEDLAALRKSMFPVDAAAAAHTLTPPIEKLLHRVYADRSKTKL
jgi:hypothetical protein